MLRSIALSMLLLIREHANAGDFSTEATFPTLAALQSALTAYTPATSSTALRAVFSLPEPGEIADGETRATRTAATLIGCDQLCSDAQTALLFATARPATDATPSEVGVLFLIVRQNEGWRVVDHQRFVAFGKYAKVVAELTAAGHKPEVQPSPPIITVKEFQGGRGYSYDLSASYTIKDQKITRHELHQ